MRRYDSIQMMRGLAAVAVVFVHIPMACSGQFGVDLFFCISGFIMMHVTATEKDARNFLLKRAVRIVPLYWAATAGLCLVSYFMPHILRSAELRPELVVKSFLFIPFTFVGKSGGVLFALYGLGWTLVLEAFFYVVFFASMKISRTHRAAICTAVLAFFVAAPSIFAVRNNAVLNFYSNPIVLEFALGMFAHRVLTRRRKGAADADASGIPDGKPRLFLAALSVPLLAGLFVLDKLTIFGYDNRLLVLGVPSCVFFLLVFKAFENVELPRPAMFLGDISYSVYLVHPFVIHGVSRLFYNIDVFSAPGLLLVIFVVLPLIVAASWISWYAIEHKFSGWLRRKLL